MGSMDLQCFSWSWEGKSGTWDQRKLSSALKLLTPRRIQVSTTTSPVINVFKNQGSYCTFPINGIMRFSISSILREFRPCLISERRRRDCLKGGDVLVHLTSRFDFLEVMYRSTLWHEGGCESSGWW